LKRAIQKYVEDALAEEIIHKISIGDQIFMDIEDGAQELTVKVQKQKIQPNL
jgi:ATP-dependent Clp protease ATP-binding subunit ClpC